MSGHGESRSWKRLAVLAVVALVLAALGVLIAHAVDRPPGGEKCDPTGPVWGSLCS